MDEIIIDKEETSTKIIIKTTNTTKLISKNRDIKNNRILYNTYKKESTKKTTVKPTFKTTTNKPVKQLNDKKQEKKESKKSKPQR